MSFGLKTVYSRFRKWTEDGTIDNIFRILSLDAEFNGLSLDATIVKTHQDSTGAPKKGGHAIETGHSRGWEPVIPSRKTAKEQRGCDWWMYKERHF